MAESYPWASGVVDVGKWELLTTPLLRKGVIAGSGVASAELGVTGSTASSVQVATGGCYLKGHYLNQSETFAVPTLPTSTTRYIVVANTGTSLAIQAVSTVTTSHLLLATAVTNSSNVTTITDNRTYAGETALTTIIGTGFSVPATGWILTGIPIPYACKVIRWELVTTGSSGTFSATVAKSSLSTFDTTTTLFSPSVTNSRYAGPTRVSGQTMTEGQYLRVNVTGATTFTQIALTTYIAPIF